jgi:hypothetical protein
MVMVGREWGGVAEDESVDEDEGGVESEVEGDVDEGEGGVEGGGEGEKKDERGDLVRLGVASEIDVKAGSGGVGLCGRR